MARDRRSARRVEARSGTLFGEALLCSFTIKTKLADYMHTNAAQLKENQMLHEASKPLIPAGEKCVDSKQSNHTAYNIMGDTDLPFFEFLKSRPDLSMEFDAYMESQAVMHSGTRIDHLLQGFDWAALEEAVVVDVGGNAGATSITFAKAFPSLRCKI